jgi:hypothetical protein
VDVALAIPGQIDGVRHGGGRRQAVPQRLAELVLSAGSSSPAALDSAAAMPPVAAAVFEHRHAPTVWRSGSQQGLRQVHELLRRVHPVHPGGVAGRVDRGALAGERAGVRAHGAGRRIGVLDRQ